MKESNCTGQCVDPKEVGLVFDGLGDEDLILDTILTRGSCCRTSVNNNACGGVLGRLQFMDGVVLHAVYIEVSTHHMMFS